MLIDQEQLERMSGYTRQADLRRYVKRNGWKLLAPGKGGRVGARIVEPTRKPKAPDFARLTAESDDPPRSLLPTG